MNYPRVLIISNECLSTSSSNGRTLRNLLKGWPIEKLAQFHLRRVAPDYEVCKNYYYVSDSAALRAFIKGNPVCGRQAEEEKAEAPAAQTKEAKPKRNALTMTARNIVWNSMRWAGKEFYKWVEEFYPQVILLQAGDSAFMLKLTLHLAKKYSIPVMVYNSEAYYFKNYDFFCSKGVAKLLYPIFHRSLCRAYKKLMPYVKETVYLCDKLKEDYDREFKHSSHVIYTASQLEPACVKPDNSPLQISYLGNLGLGREKGLAEIGNALQEISTELKLSVYGRIPNDTVKAVFDSTPGIDYRGFVSYDEVVSTIHKSDILVHTEDFSDFSREDLKYAFSTKIADSLASGTCFLLYAPDCMACSEYLKKNDAAYVAGSPEELRSVLKTLCSDPRSREAYRENALSLVQENHRAEKNSKRFHEILIGILG